MGDGVGGDTVILIIISHSSFTLSIPPGSYPTAKVQKATKRLIFL